MELKVDNKESPPISIHLYAGEIESIIEELKPIMQKHSKITALSELYDKLCDQWYREHKPEV